MTITKEAFFKPDKMSPRDKAAASDRAARQIIASETEQRDRKTARLRKLREAQEADAAPPARRKSRASASRA